MENIVTWSKAKEKGFKFYFTGKLCQKGHMAKRYTSSRECIECSREYTIKNKERIKENFSKYYENNKDEISDKKKEYAKRNRKHLSKKSNEWRERNSDKVNELKRTRHHERYRTDEDYKTSVVCRNILKRTLGAIGVDKSDNTNKMLGYSQNELREGIESKFIRGMSWENYGEWHIDHIRPVSRCISDGINDVAVINSLDNLIPMWKHHNLSKKNKTLEEFLDENKELYTVYGHFLGDKQ